MMAKGRAQSDRLSCHKIATIFATILSILNVTFILHQKSQLQSKPTTEAPCRQVRFFLRTITKEDASLNAFTKAVDFSTIQVEKESIPYGNHAERLKAFRLKQHPKGSGGLSDSNRLELAKLYANVNSVFEFGLGESTLIAATVNVPRYSGIDSDPVWVAMARDSVPDHPHYRFYFGDIGKTLEWGNPEHPEQPKNVWDYQILPLQVEREAFDIYMVDGRWRLPCLLVSFLHASARGGDNTIVLMHDCDREEYHLADHLLELEVMGDDGRLCQYKRKASTTDDQLLELWMLYYQDFV